MSAAKGPTRVAVIGGGCASLTTAFELTRPELAGRYDVTVYQHCIVFKLRAVWPA